MGFDYREYVQHVADLAGLPETSDWSARDSWDHYRLQGTKALEP
jgi:hypothetical protein